MQNRETLIDWTAEINGNGTKVPVPRITAAALAVMAVRMAATHYNLMNPPSSDQRPYGYLQAVRLQEIDNDQWKKWIGTAIDIITALHGSGEKDLSNSGIRDPASYFNALADFAEVRRRG